MKQPLARVVALLTFSAIPIGAFAQNELGPLDYSNFPPDESFDLDIPFKPLGSIERLDPAVDALLPADAQIEVLANGFNWSEGPVWVWPMHGLLFSDVPENTIFAWVKDSKIKVYAKPSGYTGATPRGGEPGSNGLTLDSAGRLVACQHGDRQVARREKDGTWTPLAQYYKWHRFNSPNDLVYHSNGDLYFTDPPYGLEGGNNSPLKELPYNGVYRLDKKNNVTLLESELTFPNGIAFSPDEKILYVAISDQDNPVIMAYDMKADGTLNMKTKRVFFDAMHLKKAGGKGSPDGLKVDKAGNLWATGPGGVLILDKDGKHLGTIATGEATANCAWGNDGSVLYITADMYLCRVKTLTKGVGPGF